MCKGGGTGTLRGHMKKTISARAWQEHQAVREEVDMTSGAAAAAGGAVAIEVDDDSCVVASLISETPAASTIW